MDSKRKDDAQEDYIMLIIAVLYNCHRADYDGDVYDKRVFFRSFESPNLILKACLRLHDHVFVLMRWKVDCRADRQGSNACKPMP